MDSVHEGIKPFPCNQCDVFLSRADSLAKHIAEIHEKYKNHKCNVCGKEYYGKFRLNQHVRSVHEGNKKSFQCNICGVEVLGSTGHLRRHIEGFHEGKKPHQCSQCGRKFYYQYLLKTHTSEIHEGKKSLVQCTICGKTLRQRFLAKHTAHVHEGKKLDSIKCGICDLVLTRRSLKMHVARVHEGQRPFKCKSCDKEFACRSGIGKHIIKFHGEKSSNIRDGYDFIMKPLIKLESAKMNNGLQTNEENLIIEVLETDKETKSNSDITQVHDRKSPVQVEEISQSENKENCNVPKEEARITSTIADLGLSLD